MRSLLLFVVFAFVMLLAYEYVAHEFRSRIEITYIDGGKDTIETTASEYDVYLSGRILKKKHSRNDVLANDVKQYRFINE